jgi:hypothetical protein
MEFLAPVENTVNGDIIMRDAVMRFQGGITNSGEIAFGGDTTIYGDITTDNTFLVLADSTSVIRGSLAFNSSAVAAFTVGELAGTLDVIGTAQLGGLLSLDYSNSGVRPLEGDSYNLLTASEGIMNTFTNTQVAAGGLLWNISYSVNMVSVTATSTISVPVGADFNGDGIVDALDLAIWDANYGRTSPPDLSALGDADGDGDVDGADFLQLQGDFGGPPTPLLAAIGAAASAVPEPSALVLFGWLVVGGLWRKR